MQINNARWVKFLGKRFQTKIALIFFVILIGVFFYKTIAFGQLPVPSDALVGLYHPWRDAFSHTFKNGVPFKNFLITDPIRQQIPWRKQVIELVKNKKPPLWDAMSFSGAPLLANIQSGALYPFNFLFFILPFSVAWTLLIISQPFLAGVFLFFFLRHKKLDIISSLVGSICFSFSGFSIAWLTWGTIVSTICWLPLILLSFEQIHISSNKHLWRIIFVFSIISSFFAGHIQIFFYCICVFLAYALWHFRKVKLQKMEVMHILIPLIIVTITSPIWIRLLSYLPETSRFTGSTWTTEGFFIPIRHVIQFIAPDFFGNPATLNYWGTWNYGEMIGYIGIIGLLLACIGFSTESFFWVLLIIAALLFAIDSPVARLPFILHIPWISSLQPTRLIAVIDFSLSILAAYGMAFLIKGDKKRNIVIFMGIFLIVFIGAWVSVLKPSMFGLLAEQVAVSKRNLILPTALYIIGTGLIGIWFLTKKKPIIFRYVLSIGILIILSFDLIRFGWKFTPFTDGLYFFPKTEIISRLEQLPKPFRVVAIDDRVLPPNVLNFYGIESISGYDPIHLLRYEEFIAAMERGEPNIKPPYGFNRIIAPKTITSPLFPLLNVNYIVSIDPIIDKRVKLLTEEGTTKLYKFTESVPRVYLAEDIQVASSKEAVIQKMYDSSFVPGKSAVIESPISILFTPLSISETATITHYSADRIVIDTTTQNKRLLVIGNMMDPYWNVTIDTKRTSVIRVNYLFFGVIIPDGRHTVTVQYK